MLVFTRESLAAAVNGMAKGNGGAVPPAVDLGARIVLPSRRFDPDRPELAEARSGMLLEAAA